MRSWNRIDAASLRPGGRLTADICIVGAGPAGLSVARALLGHGRRLLVLESGGSRTGESPALGRGRVVGLDYFALEDTRQRGLGGSSNHWDIPLEGERLGARFHPLSPADFEIREWIPHSGWPLTRGDLEPFYQQARRLCGIGPEDVDDMTGPAPARHLPLDPAVVQTAVFQLGAADRWRPERLFAGLDATGLTIVEHATVTEIRVAGGSAAVTGVRVRTAPDRELTVTAQVVVLAAGGIENARLLLLSGHGRKGLGNGRDLVGRYFMEHPWVRAGVLVPAAPNLVSGLHPYQVHRTQRGWAEARLVLTEQVRRRERLYGCGVRLRRLASDDALRSLQVARAPSGGAAAAALMVSAARRGTRPRDLGRLLQAMTSDPGGPITARRRQRPQPSASDQARYVLEVMSEQAPNPNSRVSLDQRRRDALGQPRSKLDWRVGHRDVVTITRTLDLVGAEFAERGLGQFHVPLHPELPPAGLRGGRHHMGTTRMSSDPARGVVDGNCRVHDLPNLYVAGSSVFATGGYANPTLTIVALALRLGSHLRGL